MTACVNRTANGDHPLSAVSPLGC